MRDRIDPQEEDYYQAIIWITETPAEDIPIPFSQAGRLGTRRYQVSPESIPAVIHGSTALVVIEAGKAVFDDRLIETLMKTLKVSGVLLGAILVIGNDDGKVLRMAEGIGSCNPGGGTNNTLAHFLIIGIEHRSEAISLIKLLNSFTYEALWVCADWFDLQAMVAEWESPARYVCFKAQTDDELAAWVEKEKLNETSAFNFVASPDGDFMKILNCMEPLCLNDDLSHGICLIDCDVEPPFQFELHRLLPMT